MEILKVSSKSNPNSVAGAMAGVVRSAGVVEVQVVGAGALNQAIKAVAIARGYVSSAGMDLVCSPTFADIEIDGDARTGIHLLVETRRRAGLGADGTDGSSGAHHMDGNAVGDSVVVGGAIVGPAAGVAGGGSSAGSGAGVIPRA